MVVTDIADALGLIQTNIMSNACRNVYCEELDWFNPRDLGHFDMVIGSDLVYEPKLFEPLVKTLDLVCKPDTKVFLCNELRSRTNFGFYHKMHEYGWTMSMFP